MAGIGARSIMAARKRSRLLRGVARRGLFDPMELPNTRATVFVADVNDKYVTIQFERARLVCPRVAGLKTAFHDMCDDALGLVDTIGPKIGHKAVVGRTHLRIRPFIVIAGASVLRSMDNEHGSCMILDNQALSSRRLKRRPKSATARPPAAAMAACSAQKAAGDIRS
jgi:hypothetical protein